jgi:hypothetical protein
MNKLLTHGTDSGYPDFLRRSRRHARPYFIHPPWSKRSDLSLTKIDARRVEGLIQMHQLLGRLRPIHFTLDWDGVRRLALYFPWLTMEELERQYFETFQTIPVHLTRRQIRVFASKIGHRGRRAGYLLPPPSDVYSGLPPEMMPAEDETESLGGQTDVSVLDPAPIFPTSEQLELFAAFARICRGC